MDKKILQSNGNFLIGGVDPEKLAEEYGTPLYVYDGDLIVKKYKEFLNFFPWPKLKIFYAMKANYNLAILKLLEKQGSCIDAVSPGDVLLAKKAGFEKERILFTANKITDEEMHKVKKEGVLFNIGSLSRLEKFGKSYPDSNVCIRFNPGFSAGEHEYVRTGGESTKFGIVLEKLDEVKSIAEKYNLKIVGIHEHTGSGIPETVQMMPGIKNMLKIATPENFPYLKFIDFGGGFQIPYHENEEINDYKKLGEEVIKLFSETNSKFEHELEIVFEPGKYFVSEAGILLVSATTIKENKGKIIVGTNSGFSQLIRPMFYKAYHQIKNLSNPKGEVKEYDIVGNICESGDCFGANRNLPEIREKDILAIKNAGAYCYSMGGIYNLRPMPPEVLILNNEAKLVRKGLSYEEMIDQILKESEPFE